MAKQWHPDVCREPDAEEVFKKIQDAYETLKDPSKLHLYMLGLQMSKFADTGDPRPKRRKYMSSYGDTYKPLLRCGIVECSYTVEIGRAYIQQIHAWDDIVNERGETLVSSWKFGDKEPTTVWY
jgi:curved DNA-binding protein CbpA